MRPDARQATGRPARNRPGTRPLEEGTFAAHYASLKGRRTKTVHLSAATRGQKQRLQIAEEPATQFRRRDTVRAALDEPAHLGLLQPDPDLRQRQPCT
ncbi:MAG: hypothetical protein ACK559_26240, partial [bacterium]